MRIRQARRWSTGRARTVAADGQRPPTWSQRVPGRRRPPSRRCPNTTGSSMAWRSVLRCPSGRSRTSSAWWGRRTSTDEVNSIFREEAGSARYRDIVGVSEEAIVSTDIIQDPRASIIDCTLTQVVDGDLVKVMSWYDNEWGYAAQLVREAKAVARTA